MYALDESACLSDLEALSDAALPAGSQPGGSGPSRQVRQVLAQLEMDLERMSRDCKKGWAQEQRATAEDRSIQRPITVHMQDFYATCREHVSLARARVETAAAEERAQLQEQLGRCRRGLLAVAASHAREAVGAQLADAQSRTRWEQRERLGQLDGARRAGATAARRAVAAERAAVEEGARRELREARAAHARGLASLEKRLQAEFDGRMSAARTETEAAREARDAAEAAEEELGRRVASLQEREAELSERLEAAVRPTAVTEAPCSPFTSDCLCVWTPTAPQ
jgi:chromosome segregation ATPase